MSTRALLPIAAALLFAAPVTAQDGTVDVTVAIDTNHLGAVIEPAVEGQFAENLGRGLYDGIWVGRNSPIPNTGGYRTDVMNALKALHVPVIRWPGGCFADTYDWRDGVGPNAKRPKGINTNWGGVTDDNSFGTNEFMDYTEMLGAAAYVSLNLGSLPPYASRQWVQYITDGGDSALAAERRGNGRDKPWTNLKYVGFGNELWGCGGNMTADYASDLFKRYATFVNPAPGASPFVKIASGPHDDLYGWTDTLMQKGGDQMGAISLHYYTIPGTWQHKGAATGFSEDEWATTLSKARYIDTLITKHSAIMDKYDPAKKVALYVDEWGTWYDQEPGTQDNFLFQQNTLRDAEVAALTLDIFFRHTDRVKLAAIAQMVNVLQAMVLTQGDKMLLTPTYDVFRMYVPFQGATPYPATVEGPRYKEGNTDLPMVDASAARGTDGKLYLALVNLDPHHVAQVVTGLSGSAMGQILTGPAMDTHNTFTAPDMIHPVAYSGRESGGKLTFELPAKSVAVVAVTQR
jgi:alpha-N-arabinofuranosidase